MIKYLKFRYHLLVQEIRERHKIHRTDSLSLPPPRLRHRVHGSMDPDTYKSVGINCWKSINRILDDLEVPFSQFRNVLDFGCGCGRILTNAPTEKGQNLHGWDIDHEAIAWCKRNIEGWNFEAIGHSPPTRSASRSFDLIYSVSVFTHLNERMQFEWLGELSRLLSPNGVAIFSVHGDYHREITRRQTDLANGFKYTVSETGRFKRDGLPDFYQDSQHTKEYIRKEWSKYFDVVDHIERGINGHQDAVVLRSKKAESNEK